MYHTLSDDVLNLKYTIIPGCNHFSADPELCQTYNKVYTFWKEFWNDVLRTNQSSERLNCDSFYRPYITTFLHNEIEIVGMHMYSAFDLRQLSHKDHSYFQLSCPPSFVHALEERGYESLLTMEFLTVSPQWRKSRLGFSMAEVIMSLGVKIFQSLDLDCFVTLARGDVKVPELLRRINFERHGDILHRHNTPCEAMMLPQNNTIAHPDPMIASLVDRFWNHREDLTKRFRAPHLQTPTHSSYENRL